MDSIGNVTYTRKKGSLILNIVNTKYRVNIDVLTPQLFFDEMDLRQNARQVDLRFEFFAKPP